MAESIRWGLMDSGLLTPWLINISSLHPSKEGETSGNRCSCKSCVYKTQMRYCLRGITAAIERLTADSKLNVLCVVVDFIVRLAFNQLILYDGFVICIH